MSFQLGVLGPVQATVDGVSLRLGGPRQRCALGMLALEPGRVVPAQRLTEALWGASPPTGDGNALQAVVSRLRRALAGHVEITLSAGGDGYQLHIDPALIDLVRFRDLVSQAIAARTAAPGRAAELLELALGLWRGAPLSDVDSELVAQRVAPALAEERLAARIGYHDVLLGLGRAAELLPGLSALVEEHPFEQRLCGQLMLALYRCGRIADALRVYRELRDRLAGELGLDPHDDLQQLQQSILRADDTLGERNLLPGGRPVPAQLPPVVGDFVGRTEALASLLGWLDTAAGSPAVVVSALSGQGGIGKTTLALRAAHQVASGFADGQLYVDLRGSESAPVDPSGVLVSFLLALGVDGSVIPDGLADRAALFRSTVAGRRLLIVLDNAAEEAQVRPLLPGAAGCRVLVTSRVRLSGLEGAHTVDLDVLSTTDAVELLSRVCGTARVAAEPEAAARIVRLCGQLPLAVRVAGAKLAARKHLSLASFVERLSDEQRRLDELVAGDLAVRASFEASYAGLRPEVRRAFSMLGLLDVPSFAAWVPAAMLGIGPAAAESVVEELVDAHLLQISGVDGAGQARYHFHDLVRLFAREHAAAELTAGGRAAALRAGLGAWLAVGDQAEAAMPNRPIERYRASAERPPVAERAIAVAVADPPAWFEAERQSLRAAVRQASEHGLAGLAWELAQVSSAYLELMFLHDDWNQMCQAALLCCRTAGDRLGEAVMLASMAESYSHEDNNRSLPMFRAAHDIFAELGNRRGVAEVQEDIGSGLRMNGESDEALSWLRRSLRATGKLGMTRVRAEALAQVGLIHLDRGEHEVADRYFTEAVGLKDPVYTPTINMFRGDNYRRWGRFADAEAALRTALHGYRAAGHLPNQLITNVHIGRLRTSEGRHREACEVLQDVLDQTGQVGSPTGPRVLALQAIGWLYCQRRDYRLAIAHLEECVVVCRKRRFDVVLANALRYLGEAYRETGRTAHAESTWRECARQFRVRGNKLAADEVDALLGAL